MMDPIAATALQNLVFFVIASLYVAIAARRAAGTAPFPGPRPVPTWFKVWLVVIWVVGLVAPAIALLTDGVFRADAMAATALGFYLLMMFAQIGTELFVWKRLRSPAWVIVPCLYLPWRVWQCAWGLELMQERDAPATVSVLIALFVLWVINIGVHFTNVPMTLRWDYHAKDQTFPALKDPRVFVKDAQDAPHQGAKEAAR
jgi:hypothetical protein